MMNHSKYFISGILGAALLSAGAAYGQHDVLMLVQDGNDDEQDLRDFGSWAETASDGDFSFSYSADFEVNVLDSSSELNQEQRDLLHNFDLIYVPTSGAGSHNNWGSKDWNEIQTPLLLQRPRAAGFTWTWQWFNYNEFEGTRVNEPAFQNLTVEDPTSPVFENVTIDENDEVALYESAQNDWRWAVDPDHLTGETVATVPTEESEDVVIQSPLITLWDGTESVFSDSTTEAPGGRRTAFWGPFGLRDIDADQKFTEEAGQIYLNAMGATIPEPGTYALFAGIGALGGVLLLRRLRRKA